MEEQREDLARLILRARELRSRSMELRLEAHDAQARFRQILRTTDAILDKVSRSRTGQSPKV